MSQTDRAQVQSAITVRKFTFICITCARAEMCREGSTDQRGRGERALLGLTSFPI